MRFLRSLVLVAVLLLWAAPASGAEQLVMECPVCDHVDVDGSGLEPNATLTLVITGSSHGRSAGLAAVLLGAGGLLLLATRRRSACVSG